MFFFSTLSQLAYSLQKDVDYTFANGILTIKKAEALVDVPTTAFTGPDFKEPITTVNFDANLNPTAIGKNCFNSLASLLTIAIPNTVKTIGEGAFKGCEKLNSFTFPTAPEFINIEASTFSGCKALDSQTFTIPTTIQTIGANAFEGCIGLTKIDLPATAKTIGAGAFKGCEKLNSFTFPTAPEFIKIEASTFSGCKALDSQKFKIPNTVTTIGANAFEGCLGLTEITLSAKAATIEANAFKGCFKALKVTIFGKADVDISSFSGCTSIKTVIIQGELSIELNKVFQDSDTIIKKVEFLDEITSLPNYTFAGLSGLTSAEIPPTVEKIGENSFDGCSSLEEIVYEGSTDFKDLVLGNVPKTARASVILDYPSFSFGGLDIKMEDEIGEGLKFEYDSARSSLVFKEGPTGIPALDAAKNPLERFKGAKEVVIGGDIPSIGANAFKGFTNIETLDILATTKSIGANAFDDSVNIHSITVPGSVTGFETFAKCENINKVSIIADDTLILANPIGTLFPKSKGAINEIKFSKTITTLPQAAFADLTAVKSVTIPTEVTPEGLGVKPFTNCNSLEEIHYYGTSSLASADLGLPEGKNPKIYTKIDYTGAFGSIAADKLTKVNMLGDFKWTTNAGKTLVDISPIPGLIGTSGVIEDFAVDRKSPFSQPEFANLKEVKIGEGVTKIGNYLFSGCSKLDTVSFPLTLETIGINAFDKCTGLTSIVVPENVESIGAGAFNGCTGLTSVTLNGESCRESPFTGCENIQSVTITNKLDMELAQTFAASKDKITEVNIANGVEKIKESAFSGLGSVTEIELPETVKKIGENAFKNCPNLGTIKYNGKTDFTGQNLGIPENATVIVTDAYKGDKFGGNELSVISPSVAPKDDGKNKLSTGAIVGIVIAVIVVVATIGFCVYWFVIRPKSNSDDKEDGQSV